MRLAFAFLASSAEALPDGRFAVLGGDIDTLELPKLPFRVPQFSLVAKFEFSKDECDREHQVRISIESPTGQQVSKGATVVVTPTSRTLKSGFAQGTLILDMFSTQFSVAGDHVIRIFAGEQELGSIVLAIEEAKSASDNKINKGIQ